MASLTRSTVMLAAFVAGSLILGVVRQGIVAHFFGTSAAYNAFVIAEAVPLLLLHMLFGGALAGAVVPAVVTRLREEGEAEAWRYTFVVSGAICGASVVLSGVVLVAAPWLVDGLGMGLSPEVRDQAITLTRVVAPALPLFVAATLVTAVLNAHDEFFAPGLRNLASNLPMIVVLSLVGASLGADGLVIGFLCGATFQLLVQVPRLWRLARPWWGRARLTRRPGDLSDLWRRYAPVLISHLLLQAFAVLDRSFSTVADPAGAALFLYAERIVNASRTIIGGSLAVVIFPRLTRLTTGGEDTSELIGRALGVVTLTTIPFTLILVLYGESFVSLFFEHGSFTAADKLGVASTLVGLAPAAIFIGVIILLDRIFIARDRVWIFALTLAGGLAVNVALKLLLVEPYGLVGVALGTTGGVLCAAVAALLYLRLFTEVRFLRTALRDLGSTSLAFGCSFGVMQLVPGLPLPDPWAGIAATGLALVGGGVLVHLLAPPAYLMLIERLRGD